jgi:hypothetical protein
MCLFIYGDVDGDKTVFEAVWSDEVNLFSRIGYKIT